MRFVRAESDIECQLVKELWEEIFVQNVILISVPMNYNIMAGGMMTSSPCTNK